MAGEANFEIEEADYVAAQLAAYRVLIRWPFFRTVLIMALVGGVAMTLVVSALDGVPLDKAWQTGAALGGIVATVLLAIVGANYLKISARARRLFAQNKLIRGPHNLAWNGGEITFRDRRGTSVTPLADYHRWHEGDGVFLLYTDDQAYHLIAQRGFGAEQLADLRATLVAHGPPRR